MGLCDFDPKEKKELKLKYSDNPGKRLSDESPDLQAFIDSVSHVRLSDICKIKIKNNSLKPKVKKKIKKAIKQFLKTKYI